MQTDLKTIYITRSSIGNHHHHNHHNHNQHHNYSNNTNSHHVKTFSARNSNYHHHKEITNSHNHNQHQQHYYQHQSHQQHNHQQPYHHHQRYFQNRNNHNFGTKTYTYTRRMKERANSNGTAGSTTTANVSSGSSSGSASTDAQNNFLSPYSSNNFMAPPIGAIIKCTTCLENEIQGQVVAYDQVTKMLALRSNKSNKSGIYDYSMVNVAWCSNLEVIEEPSEPPEPLSNLNIAKLERRKQMNIDSKNKEINALGNDVSTLAQHLYFTILKTLNEVEWDGKNIVVMESVFIEPPYDVASCHGKHGDNHQAVEHVKKIVKKFNEEYANEQSKSLSNRADSMTSTSSSFSSEQSKNKAENNETLDSKSTGSP